MKKPPRASAPLREPSPLSAAPGGVQKSEQPLQAVAPGTISSTHLDEALFSSRRCRRQHRPRSFRAFWGSVLDNVPTLRTFRLTDRFEISKQDFRSALQEAFLAGQGLTAAEAQQKIGEIK